MQKKWIKDRTSKPKNVVQTGIQAIMSHDPSEIILIWWFHARNIIMLCWNSCAKILV